MGRKLFLSLAVLTAIFSQSVEAFPATNPAMVASKIKNVASEAKHYKDVLDNIKQKIDAFKSNAEKSMHLDMEQAKAKAAMDGMVAQKLSQLDFLKKTAPIEAGKDAVALASASSSAVCAAVNTTKVSTLGRSQRSVSHFATMFDIGGYSNESKRKGAVENQALKRINTVLKTQEDSVGVHYADTFANSIVKPHGTIDPSVFIMGGAGFDHGKTKQAYNMVNVIVPDYNGDFISPNDQEFSGKLVATLRHDSVRAVAARVLTGNVALHAKASDGLSSIDTYQKMIIDLGDKGRDGFMTMIQNAPSIDMYPRYRMLLMGQDANVELARFKASLHKEYVLATRLADIANKQ